MIHRFGPQLAQTDASDFTANGVSFRSDVEQVHTQLQLYDPDNLDIKTARALANEIVNVTGALVKVYRRTENAFDETFAEDADPTYFDPVQMKAFFAPQPLQMEVKKWGPDTKSDLKIYFSHEQLFQQFGERMLIPGDVIWLPLNMANQQLGPGHYRIVNASPHGNYRYVWLYYECIGQILNADIAVRPENDMRDELSTDAPGTAFWDGYGSK